MIPIRDENPSGSVPVVTRALIAVNAAVFVYELMIGPGIAEFFYRWGMVPLRVSLAVTNGTEPLPGPALTFVTSMFLHGGWAHLLGNMWYLWIFGDNLEDRMGKARYIVFYLAGGLVAAGVQYALHSTSRAPTVGASGAIAAVLGGYALLYPGARVFTLLPIFPFIRIVPLPAVLVLGLWFVLQFFIGALALGTKASGGVAWWAHIGGSVFGLVMVRLFARPSRAASGAWIEP
ncbi:MAG: rhomboid family intramembrane serine protease [Candidatus Eisenbacteria bacterium]